MSVSAPDARRDGVFASLRIANFRHLWAGQVCHAGALWMEQIARPLLILEVTRGSAWHVGAVIAVRTLPQLLFGVWGGVVSDWVDRRRVLLADKSAVLAINVAFAALILLGRLELWHIYAYAFLRGSLLAFDQPARQSLIPSVVPADRVTNAIALMSMTQNLLRILGALFGAMVYATLGPEGAFTGVAAIYVGAVGFTYLLDVPTHARPEADRGASMTRGLLAGMRFAFAQPAIRGVLVLAAVFFTFGMSYSQVFLPLFATAVLDVGAWGLGWMLALAGAGALISGVIIARGQPARIGTFLVVDVIAFGAVIAAFSLATYLPRPGGLAIALALLMLAGGMQTAFFVLSRSLMLHSAPAHMHGRVLSLLSLDRAFMSGGAAAAGFLAGAIGVREAQLLYGAVCAAAGLAVLAFARSFRSAGAAPGADATPAPAPVSTLSTVFGEREPRRRGGAGERRGVGATAARDP